MQKVVQRPSALAIGRVTHWLSVCKLPTTAVPSEQVVAIASDTYAAFCSLQCRSHEIWSLFFGSSMKDDLRYTPSDCFETFPFPLDWESDARLEEAGKAYYEFRAALMVANNEGLTKTYNRFHDPEHDGSGVAGRSPREVVADVERLRELHEAMDRAVLAAYGWTDIPTRCEFLLDYEEPEADDDEGRSRRRKKPYRYRWPDEVRDEVLARLLELNKVRAEEERLAGVGAGGKKGRKAAAQGATVAKAAPRSGGAPKQGSLGPLFDGTEPGE